MKIVEVSFERVFNLGNYQTMRIGLVAKLDPGEKPEDMVAELSAHVTKCRSRALEAGRPGAKIP